MQLIHRISLGDQCDDYTVTNISQSEINYIIICDFICVHFVHCKYYFNM